MREICLEEGILQSYLDGELSLAMTEQVAGHLAACAACAEMVREAESELAIFGSAFAAELAWPVPTEQLRVRINQAIDTLETHAPPQAFQPRADSGPRAWLKALAAAFAFNPQRAAGFASLLALVAFALIFSVVYKNGPAPAGTNKVEPTIAVNNSPAPLEPSQPVSQPDQVSAAGPSLNSTTVIKARQTSAPQRPVEGRYLLAANRRAVKVFPKLSGPVTGEMTTAKTTTTPTTTPAATIAELPGEKSYLKTIASLTVAIDTGGSPTMKPALRAEYERNLALVNQAIAATRPVALSKPGDPAAVQFLYSAYKSKIDLLSAVADQQSEAIARR